MMLEDPKLWLDFLQWITTIAIGIYVWRSKHDKAIQETIAEQDKRLSKAEQKLAAVPDHSDMLQVVRELSTLSGDVKAMAATINGVKDLLPGLQAAQNMTTEYLMTKDK